MTRLVQYRDEQGARRVAVVETADRLSPLDGYGTTYDLAQAAIAAGQTLDNFVAAAPRKATVDYARIVAEGRLLVPFDHPDPAHLLVSGTGLTHLGSADTRDKMHAELQSSASEALTDTMAMFKQGLAGGKPAPGTIGVAPEWFYKGSGHSLVAPGQPLPSPGFAEDAGGEPELSGLYLIGPDGKVWRIGFALGNEFSDHVTERRNYLLLAHSKLRPSSFGPELLVGEAPRDIRGMSAIRRDGAVIWQKPFLTGEANMSHTIANLEHHHFKYDTHRVPGDVHVHYFGTATLSFGDGIRTRPGDVFEISSPDFGRPLKSPLLALPDAGLATVSAL